MKMTVLVLSPLVVFGTAMANTELPNCYNSNYGEQYKLFTIVNPTAKAVNQQCLLTVAPLGSAASGRHLTAGTYLVSVSNGGGGGAGGTIQSGSKFPGADNSGGGGGGGAGAAETKATIKLTEGVYRLTIGVGGPGGKACSGPPNNFPGGPGWSGSPTNIVRVATGEVIIGEAGAATYVRPSRAQHERAAGKPDGHGGHGPGQTSGGDGTKFNTSGNVVQTATAGESKPSPSVPVVGGDAGKPPLTTPTTPVAGPGGGGGASTVAVGGTGGTDTTKHVIVAPTHGTLGSGGGGGKGDSFGCAAGADGGHGFVSFVPI